MNWMWRNSRPSDRARAWERVVLPTPGTFDEQMAACEQAGDGELERLVLADNDLGKLGDQFLDAAGLHEIKQEWKASRRIYRCHAKALHIPRHLARVGV